MYLYLLEGEKRVPFILIEHIVCLLRFPGFWQASTCIYSSFRGCTLPETNSSPLKIFHPKRRLVFQPSIFRCELAASFREGKYHDISNPPQLQGLSSSDVWILRHSHPWEFSTSVTQIRRIGLVSLPIH